jgi:hypothetical protein
MNQESSFAYKIGNSIIKITKIPITQMDGMVNAIVVGEKEQLLQRGTTLGFVEVGFVRESLKNTLFIKNKESLLTKSTLFMVGEPVDFNAFGYNNDNEEKKALRLQHTQKELAGCYTNILTHLAQYKEIKKIALPGFLKRTGIPKENAIGIISKVIVEYVKDNPDRYASIHVLVKRTKYIDLYKKNILEAINALH